jgi:hypothetical protein
VRATTGTTTLGAATSFAFAILKSALNVTLSCIVQKPTSGALPGLVSENRARTPL